MKIGDNSEAIHTIHSKLSQLENAWNSHDIARLIDLFDKKVWVVDPKRGLCRQIATARLTGFLFQVVDPHSYCLLVVEYVLILADDFGYTTTKVRIRDHDAELQNKGNLILIFRPTLPLRDWRIQLFQFIG